ncbi:MAG: hypothetical protein LQ342_000646 [Letrouitia transgressa]|nr:MAG: hypothetical protein LQ342_000646 [Letrouitia transgressa]
MASKKLNSSPKATLPFKVSNKDKRQKLHITRKKAHDSIRREERLRRRREEDKNPFLREERLKKNVPLTLERKRIWDEIEDDSADGLGQSVDVEQLKRQKTDQYAIIHKESETMQQPNEDTGSIDAEDDKDSMIDSTVDSTDDEHESDESLNPPRELQKTATERATSPAQSTTGTNLDLTPEALAERFPTLFSTEAPHTPKILITTSLNSNLHHEAQILTSLFPHSVYIPRSSHRYGHKFSVRKISSFASKRNYTAVIVLKEDQKRPTGLTFVHLPRGPTFHFSINNWLEGKKVPGHGRPTIHTPELILNNFRTPLGLLTAHLFRAMFPHQPELQGRQVVTLHNQRDYIFVRRHRYIFREKRATEKSVIGPDGKEVKGVEGIRAGLQELGPRFTLKLRRIDKGIQRESGQEWEWKGKMEKQRTKFQL